MKNRRSLMVLLVGVALMLGVVFARGFDLLPQTPWTYVLSGAGCGLFGYGFSNLANGRLLRQYPQLAREKRIQEQDERNISIKNQAKAKGYDLMTYLFAALLLVMAGANASLWLILLAVGVYLAIQGYALYWRFRLEKEQ